MIQISKLKFSTNESSARVMKRKAMTAIKARQNNKGASPKSRVLGGAAFVGFFMAIGAGVEAISMELKTVDPVCL